MRSILITGVFSLFCLLSAGQSVRILVVTGGHSFNEPAFYNLFKSMDSIAFDTVSQPRAGGLWSAGLANIYDVIVFYDMTSEISGASMKRFLEMCDAGQPLLFLHHSLCSYQNWPEYRNIVGGKYFLEPAPGKNKASRYKHDISLEIFPAGSPHPVVSHTLGGKQSFVLTDEGYADIEVMPDVTPLLMTSHPDCFPLVGWTHRYKNSPVIYLMPGHDEKTYSHPMYLSLVRNSILWLSDQKKHTKQ